MKKIVVRALLVVVAVALAAGGFMVYQMGPRNAWGMLRYDQRQEGSLRVGDRAPDVALTALDGSPIRLQDRIGQRPLVLIFGSYT